MKIVSLTAENVKRLSAVEIRPDGALVQITGRNGAGKTSVLDSIWWALAGTKNIQDSPIHAGESKARIRLDLGDMIVERRFTGQDDGGYTTALKVTSAEGATYPSPQSMLDSMLGALAFDPLAFARKAPRDQRDAIRSLVPADLDALDAADKADYDARRDLNREAKTLRAQIDAFDLPATRPETIDVSALVESLDAAGRTNSAIEGHRRDRADAERNLGNAEREVERLEVELEHAREKRAALAEALAAMDPIRDPVDTSAIRAQIEAAREANDAAKCWDERAALTKALAEKDAESEALTKAMKARERERIEAFASADLPVEGLGITTDGVTLNGLPFDVASDAEKLRVSVALAAAMEPKLRVIRIRDGSLLDAENLASLSAFATERDMQI